MLLLESCPIIDLRVKIPMTRPFLITGSRLMAFFLIKATASLTSADQFLCKDADNECCLLVADAVWAQAYKI